MTMTSLRGKVATITVGGRDMTDQCVGFIDAWNIRCTRRAYARAWKAWRMACAIRAAHRGSRPVKAWYDECRVMLARAERNHRRALSRV